MGAMGGALLPCCGHDRSGDGIVVLQHSSAKLLSYLTRVQMHSRQCFLRVDILGSIPLRGYEVVSSIDSSLYACDNVFALYLTLSLPHTDRHNRSIFFAGLVWAGIMFHQQRRPKSYREVSRQSGGDVWSVEGVPKTKSLI